MNEVREVNINVPRRAVVINKYTRESGSWIWLLGFIGAVVYYWQGSSGFGEYVVGFLKALVWPAYLIYHSLKFFGV